MPSDPGTSAAGAGLVVDRVRIDAGAVRILHDVSLSLRRGELCALIGPSGAGKSTLIKTLLGLWEPDEGTVRCDGRPVAAAGPIGYVPQDDAVHRALTVRQALTFAARLRAPALRPRQLEPLVDDLCRRLDLAERLEVRIKRLSGGQRKRVSVAMELLTDPGVLVLDEPTSGLDPGLEARLMDLFSDVARGGRVVLVATHAMQSLERCDALLILMAGRIVYLGPPAAAPAHFGAEDYADIFHRLAEKSAKSWEQVYRMSADCRAFRDRPGPAPDAGDGVGEVPLFGARSRGRGGAPASPEVPGPEGSGPEEHAEPVRGWPPPRKRREGAAGTSRPSRVTEQEQPARGWPPPRDRSAWRS